MAFQIFTTFFWEYVSESAIIPRMMRAQGRSGRNGRADRNKTKDNDSFIGLLRKRTGLNIDLPTVSEWIYFGRAGSVSPFNNGGSVEDDLKMLGRYKGNKNDGKAEYADGPSAVGMYLPNAWGIYDIHGGVSEWCLDNGKEAPIALVVGAAIFCRQNCRAFTLIASPIAACRNSRDGSIPFLGGYPPKNGIGYLIRKRRS